MLISLIHALVLTKRVAAKVNQDLGLLMGDKARVIMQATDEVSADKHRDELPLVIWQIGSGTQGNMNMNEVLANRTSELLGGARGVEREVYPNDDVNKSQSSNDIFSTTVHVAVLLALCKPLIPQSDVLTRMLSDKSHALVDIVKVGRTYLQDATPLTLGQEISGWVAMPEHNLRHIENSLPHVAELVLGETAANIGLNTYPEYAHWIADELRVITCMPLITTPNKFEVLATYDTPVHAHGALKRLAASLIKVASDVRWLASDPCCGIGEVSIPENEPDGSIIPGKVNPIQCEALTMSCCQVVGSDVAINMGGVSGNFGLNVYRSMVIRSFLQPIRLLADGMESFNEHCTTGIGSNRERIDQLLNEPLMLVTVLNTHIDYDKAAEITKKAHKEGLILETSALALGYLTETEFDSWIRPELMIDSIRPGS